MLKPLCCCALMLLVSAGTLLSAAERKPVVYVAERNSLQVTSTDDTLDVNGGGTGNSMGAATIKDLNRSCPQADVTLNRRSADYVLIVGDTHGFPGEKDKQAVVSTVDGKVFYSTSARLLGSAVKDVCGAIVDDWARRSQETLNLQKTGNR